VFSIENLSFQFFFTLFSSAFLITSIKFLEKHNHEDCATKHNILFMEQIHSHSFGDFTAELDCFESLMKSHRWKVTEFFFLSCLFLGVGIQI
jgi:hypothetical protein